MLDINEDKKLLSNKLSKNINYSEKLQKFLINLNEVINKNNNSLSNNINEDKLIPIVCKKNNENTK